ncbi:MAG: hypothetical protein C4316_09685 [Chloroflexota bacterium]
MGFEFLDHTAEIGVRAWGRDLAEAFAEAARGMFAVMYETGPVGETLVREVEVSAPDPEALLVEWLNSLLYLATVDHAVFGRFEVNIEPPKDGAEWRLRATAYGEPVDPARHSFGLEVKAATYHGLKVQSLDGRAEVQVILDV